MSVLLLTGGAALALAFLSQPAPVKPEDVKASAFSKKPMGPDEILTNADQLHGHIGDISEISGILKFPGMIVGSQIGQDLRGTPCRWLLMRNGAKYRTYDMDTEYY